MSWTDLIRRGHSESAPHYFQRRLEQSTVRLHDSADRLRESIRGHCCSTSRSLISTGSASAEQPSLGRDLAYYRLGVALLAGGV